MNLNRKKAIILLSGFQAFVLALICVFLHMGYMSITTFFYSAIAIALITSALLVVIIKKTNN